ncbi:GntR family transcriptional regulator [Brucepastera parasyntrophica]|uniref:GntR family transcriptional regulator n=1 Tax=Brucepastera parasyntrophica TaxID=2880008 RepID=UPI00210EBB6C|nr:GntR family transcriptional regulator [Brucepastera parasyntrophica]ULQ60713.1 GntR family transcriptional regulator [Brucepastera parasyntrophica]
MADFDPNIPIYFQIINAIKQKIVAGLIKPGERLPSVREYAEELSVNPNTVQRAYQELEREGITETKRGMGSFITENESLIPSIRKEMAKSLTRTFIKGMTALSFTKQEILQELANQLEESK